MVIFRTGWIMTRSPEVICEASWVILAASRGIRGDFGSHLGGLGEDWGGLGAEEQNV